MKNYKLKITAFLVLLIAIVGGVVVYHRRIQVHNYKVIAGTEDSVENEEPSCSDLRDQIYECIDGVEDDLGFSYYNLTTGEYVGINDDSYFTGASTVKVPI